MEKHSPCLTGPGTLGTLEAVLKDKWDPREQSGEVKRIKTSVLILTPLKISYVCKISSLGLSLPSYTMEITTPTSKCCENVMELHTRMRVGLEVAYPSAWNFLGTQCMATAINIF